jgi:hypothetical protein
MPRVPIPASSLARALPPVASINRPSAEPRTTAPVTISMPSTTTTGAGTPSTAPLPSQTRSGAVKVTMRPSVMSCATPRPGHHQDQGGDDRLDAEHRNEKAVPQPA